MSQLNERTFQMMEAFIGLHDQGFTISEIAKRYKLSESTVYRRLPEIAQKAGRRVEDLKQRNFEADHSGRNFTPVKPVDTTEFHEHFNSAMTELKALQDAVGRTIEDQTILSELYEEEFK